MKKLFYLIITLTVATMFFVGCSTDQTSVSPDFRASMAPIILPTGATVVSASLNIAAYIGSDQPVNVHRVTSDWDEITVTWNSFGGAFDPIIEGTFIATAGWHAVDITDLFNDWANGSSANFGLLLDQVEMAYPRAIYYSREFYSNHAFLEVTYILDGIETTIQEEVIADTYIWETAPDQNGGTSEKLYTGWETAYDLEKQTLIKFEIVSSPQDGCTHTIGYWKNHAGFGPQADEVTQYLPIMLGSFEVVDATMAVDVLKMKTYGKHKNGITKLMAQFLATKLSIADGASDADIANEISDADNFLSTYDWTDWKSLSKSEQKDVLILKTTFDDYNNGYIGPGHCDEYDEDNDYSDGSDSDDNDCDNDDDSDDHHKKKHDKKDKDHKNKHDNDDDNHDDDHDGNEGGC